VTGSGAHHASTEDDAQLAALGYRGEFDRGMGLWANMALGFTYLSPLVGVYSLWAFSLSIGGPPAIWWIVIVGIGQLLVALVFGEVVSQYPLAGGIYPWTRRHCHGSCPKTYASIGFGAFCDPRHPAAPWAGRPIPGDTR